MNIFKKILFIIAALISFVAVFIGALVLLVAGILISPILWLLGKRKFPNPSQPQQKHKGSIDAEYEIIEPEKPEIKNEKSSD